MLKKIAVAALMSGFTIAALAQASAAMTAPAMSVAPAAVEQTADAPHCEKRCEKCCEKHGEKHGKHHHCDKKHAEHKVEAHPAAPDTK